MSVVASRAPVSCVVACPSRRPCQIIASLPSFYFNTFIYILLCRRVFVPALFLHSVMSDEIIGLRLHDEHVVCQFVAFRLTAPLVCVHRSHVSEHHAVFRLFLSHGVSRLGGVPSLELEGVSVGLIHVVQSVRRLPLLSLSVPPQGLLRHQTAV